MPQIQTILHSPVELVEEEEEVPIYAFFLAPFPFIVFGMEPIVLAFAGLPPPMAISPTTLFLPPPFPTVGVTGSMMNLPKMQKTQPSK